MKDQSARHATSAVVEYGLVRHTLVAALQNGSLTRDEICDAHPELMRAARNRIWRFIPHRLAQAPNKNRQGQQRKDLHLCQCTWIGE